MVQSGWNVSMSDASNAARAVYMRLASLAEARRRSAGSGSGGYRANAQTQDYHTCIQINDAALTKRPFAVCWSEYQLVTIIGILASCGERLWSPAEAWRSLIATDTIHITSTAQISISSASARACSADSPCPAACSAANRSSPKVARNMSTTRRRSGRPTIGREVMSMLMSASAVPQS